MAVHNGSRVGGGCTGVVCTRPKCYLILQPWEPMQWLFNTTGPVGVLTKENVCTDEHNVTCIQILSISVNVQVSVLLTNFKRESGIGSIQ